MSYRYRFLSALLVVMPVLSISHSGSAFAVCEGGAEVCLAESTDLPVAEVVPDNTSDSALEETSTDTYTAEQEALVNGITRDLKRRSLTRPSGNNAHEKILRLREIHPNHDYSVNGEKYIARILVLLGRQAVRRGELELASRHLLKALKFDPKVKRQSQLKKAIASGARTRGTKQKTEETKAAAYLPGNDDSAKVAPVTDEVRFVAPVMVAIPAGNFLMGSEGGAEDEKPLHHVTLEAFSMSKHEITMQQYRVFALATGLPAPQYPPEQSNLPAVNVSWRDAVAYTRWLSGKTKRQFRLPSESEWEYAARAGTTTAFFTGDSLLKAANCVGCEVRWGGKSAAPVGSFEPNEFGLYDMHGNVWEWVRDCWTDNYNGRTKSAVAVEIDGCERRVLRGGSWYNDADYARSSYRGNETPVFRDSGVGFRVVHDGL